MERCETCAYWERLGDEDHGLCTAILERERILEPSYAYIAISDGEEDREAQLITSEDFGCVMYGSVRHNL